MLDTRSREVRRVPLPEVGPEPAMCQRAEPNTPTHGVALTPDDKELWVTSLNNGSVYVYDIARQKFSGPIHTGACPNWISISPGGEYVTVSNSGQNTVAIIDAKAEKVVASDTVGERPKRLLVIDVPPS